MPISLDSQQAAVAAECGDGFAAAVLTAQLHTSPDGILIVDPDRTILAWNRRFAELWGYAERDLRGSAPTLRPAALEHLRDPAEFAKRIEALYQQPDEVGLDLIFFRNGQVLERYSAPVRGVDGTHYGRLFQYRDVTERHGIELELRESEERFRRAFQYAAIGMALVGLDGQWFTVNPTLCAMLGYSQDEFWRQHYQDLMHPEDRDAELELAGQLARGEIEHYHVEQRYLHKSGRVVWALLSASALPDENGQARYFIIQLQDISKHKDLEEALRYQAHHDALTGLLNREGFQPQLERVRAAAGGDKGALAMFLLDLDGFKWINDSYGHQIGDAVLQEAADRLCDCLRQADIVARLGGDEFVVLLPGVPEEESLKHLAARIEAAIAAPMLIDDRELCVDVSLGISRGPQDEDIEELLRRADKAMYVAKYQKRGLARVMSPEDTGDEFNIRRVVPRVSPSSEGHKGAS